jgi:signal transduction histidine kinase
MDLTPPFNEQARLEALQRYRILDTSPEEAFDDLVHTAALVCRTPISLVSLVDSTRQWFKARTGLAVPELPRESAFCAHAIMGSDVLVVPDTYLDPRFAANPLVVGDPYIRFYAGAPIITLEGLGLGTLCVIDRAPRTIGPEETRALRGLARQVMLQLELRRMLLDFDERTRELDAFTFSVAHDLRTPLRGIRGLAEIVLADYSHRSLNRTGTDLIGRMKDAAGRLDALIEGLLAYARASRQQLTLEPVQLGPFLVQLLEELAPELQARRAVVQVQGDLPRVRAHPLALRQILANLLSNAAKFVSPDVPPRISVTAVEQDGKVVVNIADNGIGMGPDLQARIFQPFIRAEASYPGVGLGLSVVRSAVERMGGRVGVDSQPGKGSRFWFELPAEPAGD